MGLVLFIDKIDQNIQIEAMIFYDMFFVKY